MSKPINVQDIIRLNGGYDPAKELTDISRRGYEPLNKYDAGLNAVLDQEANRAANQTNWEAFGNAFVQSLAEISLGTLEGTGYLFDFEQHGNLVMGTEKEFTNWFSSAMRDAKESVGDAFPVYGGEGFQPWNPRFWAKNLPSIASSLSLLIPAAGATRLIGKAGKGLGLENQLSKLARGKDAVEKLNNVARQKNALKGITGAVTSRYMENTMEATEMAQSEFNKLVAQGVPEEQARIQAGKAASKVWYANAALLLADIPQYMMLFGAVDDVAKGMFKKSKSIRAKLAKNFFVQPASEGLEEGIQYGIQQEAPKEGNVFANMAQNFTDYFDDPEFWTSVTLGAAGGLLFGTLGQGVDKNIIKKNFNRLDKYIKADRKGDEGTKKVIEAEVLAETTAEEKEAVAELMPEEAPESQKKKTELKEIAKTQAQQEAKYEDQGDSKVVAQEKAKKDVVIQTLQFNRTEITQQKFVDDYTKGLENTESNDLVNAFMQKKIEDQVQDNRIKQTLKDKYPTNTTTDQVEGLEISDAMSNAGKLSSELDSMLAEDIKLEQTKLEKQELSTTEGQNKLIEKKVEEQEQEIKDTLDQLPSEELQARFQNGEETEKIKEILTDRIEKEEQLLYQDEELAEENFPSANDYIEAVSQKYPTLAISSKAKQRLKDNWQEATSELTDGSLEEDTGIEEAIVEQEWDNSSSKHKNEPPVTEFPEPPLKQDLEEVEETERVDGETSPFRVQVQDLYLSLAGKRKVLGRHFGNEQMYGEAFPDANESDGLHLIRNLREELGDPKNVEVQVTATKRTKFNETATKENFQVVYTVVYKGTNYPIGLMLSEGQFLYNLINNGKAIFTNEKLSFQFKEMTKYSEKVNLIKNNMADVQILDPLDKKSYAELQVIRQELWDQYQASNEEVVHHPMKFRFQYVNGFLNYKKGAHNIKGDSAEDYKPIEDLGKSASDLTLAMFNPDGTFKSEQIEKDVLKKHPDYYENKQFLEMPKDGWLYHLEKDTNGQYRWLRLRTRKLHESKKAYERLFDILNKAKLLHEFIIDNNITLPLPPKGSYKDLSDALLKLREDVDSGSKPFQNLDKFTQIDSNGEKQGWAYKYLEYRKEIQDTIVRVKNEKGKFIPDFNISLPFISKKFLDNKVFSPQKYLEKLNIIKYETNDKGETVLNTPPVQISTRLFSASEEYRNTQLEEKLTTNLVDFNNPFVSPTFYMEPTEKIEIRENKLEKSQEESQSTQSTENTTINIYAGTNENAELSNFAKRPFKFSLPSKIRFDVDVGIEHIFNSVEEAFQYFKGNYAAKYDPQDILNEPDLEKNQNKKIEIQNELLSSEHNPRKAKKLGRQYPDLNVKEWDKKSPSLMKALIQASFEQNPDASQKLLDTGNATLTHTQDKGKWGKLFPKILMEVREELRKNMPVQEESLSTFKGDTEIAGNDKRRVVRTADGAIRYQYAKGTIWKDYANQSNNPAVSEFAVDVELNMTSSDKFKTTEEKSPTELKEDKLAALKASNKKKKGNDLKYRVVDKSNYKPIDTAAAKKWLQKTFKGLNVEIQEGLLTIGNIRAWGLTKNKTVILSDAANVGTEYHEAFHVAFNNILSKVERQNILAEAKKRFTLKESDLVRAQQAIDSWGFIHDIATPEEVALEEYLAEEFRQHMMTQQSKSWLQKVFDKIKAVIDFIRGTDNVSQIEQLYRNIEKGKFSGRELQDSYAQRYQMTDFSPREERQVINILLGRIDAAISELMTNGKIKDITEGYKLLFEKDVEKNILLSKDMEESVFNDLLYHYNSTEGINEENFNKLLYALRPDLVTDSTQQFGYIYNKVLNNIYTRGVDIRSRSVELGQDEAIEYDENEHGNYEEWFKYANISVSPKEKLGVRIKRMLNNIPTSKQDDLGLGFTLMYSGNEIYTSLQSEIGNSIDTEDMLEKIANSKIPFVKGLYELVSTNGTIRGELFDIAQKQHPDFKTVLSNGNEIRVISSNQDKLEYFIINDLFDLLNEDSEFSVSDLILQQYTPADLVKVRNKLAEIIPYSVVEAIATDNKLPNVIRSLNTAITSTKADFKTRFRPFATAVKEYYPETYQSSHLNVEGERVYEWMNANFIGRLVNHMKKDFNAVKEKYITDQLYANLPIFKEQTPTIPQLIYLDGIKYQGQEKGIKYKNYSDRDMLLTLLAYHYQGQDKGIYPLPVLETAPVMVGVQMKKYNNSSAKKALTDAIKFEFDRVHRTFKTTNIKNYVGNSSNYHMFKNIMGDATEYNKTDINKRIDEYVEETRRQLLQKMTDLGIISVQNGIYQTELLPSAIEDVPAFVDNYILNHVLNHSQLALISVGDPAYYKSIEDYYKRAKEIHSPGRYLDMSATYVNPNDPDDVVTMKEVMKAKVAPDIESRSKQADDVEKVIGKNKAYDKSSLTDAQTYIDIFSYRMRQVGLTRWNDEQQGLFDILLKGELPTKYGKKASWNVMKPFFYNMEVVKETDYQMLVPTQKKDSEFVLIPAYGLKKIGKFDNPFYNEKYKEILEGMGYQFTESTVKYDKIKREYDLYTFDTTIKTGRNNPDDIDIMELSTNSWRLQQETPAHHFDDHGNFGTQIMKLITSDIELDLDYDGMTGRQLIERYNALIVQDINESFEEVKDRFSNINELRAILRDEIMARGLGDEYIKLMYDESFPLWHPVHYYRVSSILNSIFKKNVTKREFDSGFSFVNTSAFGYSDDLSIKWVNDDPNQGVEYLEVYAPIYSSKFKKFINEEGFIDQEAFKQIENEAPDLLKGIVYRIPTEDKFSMLPIKIKGFLPIDTGSIIMPWEVTTIAGLDFDIDKVYGFYYNYEKVDQESVDVIDKLELMDFAKGQPDNVLRYIDSLSVEELANIDNMRYSEIKEEFMLPELASKVKSILSEYMTPKRYNLVKNAGNDTRQGRDNEKIDLMLKILNSKHTVKSMVSPQGFDRIEKTNENIKRKRVALDFINPLSLVTVAKRMNTGQGILGIYANGNAVHSMLQYSKLFKIPLVLSQSVKFNNRTFDTFGNKYEILPNGNEGDTITRNIGMRVGMAADNGKNPQAEYYNANTYTADVEVMLLQLGVDSDTIQYFLSQPSIVEFTERYFNNGASSQAEADLLREYGLDRIKKSDPMTNMNTDHLMKYTQNGQEAILRNFVILKKLSKDVFAFQSAIKSGDKGAGITNIHNYARIRELNKSYDDVIAGADKFIKSQHFMLEMIRKGIIEANSVINEAAKFPILGGGFETILSQLEKNKGYNLTVDEITDIFNDYVTFIFGNIIPFDQKVVDDAITGLIAFKKENPGHPLTSKLSIKVNQTEKHKGERYLEFRGVIGSDPAEIDEIKKSWSDLPAELVDNLVKYSIYQSGVNQTFRGFGHVQPIDYHIRLFRQHGKEMENYLSMLGQSVTDLTVQDTVVNFLNQYIRNNFRNLKSVPSIVNKVDEFFIRSEENGMALRISKSPRLERIFGKSMLYAKYIKYYSDTLKDHVLFRRVDGTVGDYQRVQELGRQEKKKRRFTVYGLENDTLNPEFNEVQLPDVYNQIGKTIEDYIEEGIIEKNCE